MKRTPLKRKTPLIRKSSFNKVSEKQELELAKRRIIKFQLWLEQDSRCKVCQRMLKYRECELSHKKSLSQGGKTEIKNCEVTCAWWISGCHSNIEHGRNNKYNEQPDWSK